MSGERAALEIINGVCNEPVKLVMENEETEEMYFDNRVT